MEVIKSPENRNENNEIINNSLQIIQPQRSVSADKVRRGQESQRKKGDQKNHSSSSEEEVSWSLLPPVPGSKRARALSNKAPLVVYRRSESAAPSDQAEGSEHFSNSGRISQNSGESNPHRQRMRESVRQRLLGHA